MTHSPSSTGTPVIISLAGALGALVLARYALLHCARRALELPLAEVAQAVQEVRP